MPEIVKTKLVGEFQGTPKGKFADKVCYLYMESDGRISLTVEGTSFKLLLPLNELRDWMNKGVFKIGLKSPKRRKEVRKLKTKHTIKPKDDKAEKKAYKKAVKRKGR